MTYKTKGTYKWIVLGIIFLLMTTFAISLQALPPIFEYIMEDIPFSNSQAGMLMGAYAIPGIFLSFLIAHLANRFNKKTMIIAALSIIIFGLVAFSLSKSFASLLIFRIISGIGATALVVLAPLLVTMWFQQEEMGVAMGIFNTAVPFGTVVAANLFGILGGMFEWKFIILGIAIFTGLVLLISLLMLSLPKDNDIEEIEGSEKTQDRLWSNKSLWALGLIWALANAQLLAYVTFGPQHFQLLGITPQRAGFMTSSIMLIPIFASPIVGIIIDKIGREKQLVFIGSILIGLSFIMIGRNGLGLGLWPIILGIGFSPIPVIVFSMLPQIVKPHQIGMGLGLLTVASNVGITAGPPVFGFLLDKTGGNFYMAFMVLALVSIGIILTLGGLKTYRQ